MGSYSNKVASGPATAAQNAKAVKLFAEGVKFQEIMDKTGLSMAQADRAIYSHRATTRLESLEISGVSETALFWLGAPSFDREHDAVYSAVAGFTVAADLSAAEFKDLADRVAQARSDEAAVAIVTAEAEAMSERIASVAKGTWKRSAGVQKTPVERVLSGLDKLSEEEIAALKAALA